MSHNSSNKVEGWSEGAWDLVEQQETELNALLDRCAARPTRSSGIPAILIVDDFTSREKKTMVPAAGDADLGKTYADLSLALAVLVEAHGGVPDYPSICPAMSAIAEWNFGSGPFEDWKSGPGQTPGPETPSSPGKTQEN